MKFHTFCQEEDKRLCLSRVLTTVAGKQPLRKQQAYSLHMHRDLARVALKIQSICALQSPDMLLSPVLDSSRHGTSTTRLMQLLKCVVHAGEDIAWEVASCAREVVLSAKTWMNAEYGKQVLPFGPRSNMFRRGWVQELRPDGSVHLEDGTLVEDVDVVMFCTGASFLCWHLLL